MPIPVLSARFSKVDTMLPDWLAMPIRPAGGYGATICAQSDDGVDTMPWPFGPASRTPASSRGGGQLVLGAAAGVARLGVSAGHHERRAHALARAVAHERRR